VFTGSTADSKIFAFFVGKEVKKKEVKQSRYRPGVAQTVPGVKFPRFHDNGTGWW
jgi:hypothetical protein